MGLATMGMTGLSIAPGVLIQLTAFFAVALLLLTYLGAGITASTHPDNLASLGWLIVPFLGYSVLVAISALLVAFGADVETSLAVALGVSTIANVWAFLRGHAKSLGTFRQWFALPALALPSFAVAALVMAHNGSTTYVGGQTDLVIVLPLTDWLKNHTAPLFSVGSPTFISPGWMDSVAPLGGWLREGVRLGSAGHSPEEVQAVFQRGPVFLMSSLAAIMGWDSATVYRPTLAFLLSLSLPATFVFCRKLAGAGTAASLLAVIASALNGTVFFWVAFGHPSQSVALGLLPISVLLVLYAVEARDRASIAGAALAVSALLISYYWAVAPITASLLVPPLVHLFIKDRRKWQVAARAASVGAGVVIIALPEHIKMLMLLMSGKLTHVPVPVAGSSGLPAIGDALGTTLHQTAFALVAGQGQVEDLGLTIYGAASLAATLGALLLAMAGLVGGRSARLGQFRAIFAGPLVLLAALAISGYFYGYDKAQASITFLFSAALALGVERVWVWAFSSADRHGRYFAAGRTPVVLALGAVSTLVGGAIIANFALSTYIFWKPVGNIWDPRAWEARDLALALPREASVKVSPNVLTSPESMFTTLSHLRDQVLEGTFSLGGIFNRRVLFLQAPSLQPSDLRLPADSFELIGANEIAAARGALPENRVWRGALVSAYRSRENNLGPAILGSSSGGKVALSAGLPAVIEDTGKSEPGALVQFVLVFASDQAITLKARLGQEVRYVDVGPGVSVRTIPARSAERAVIEGPGSQRVRLLGAFVRSDPTAETLSEDYPKVLAAVGSSAREDNVIDTHFTYLNIGVLAFHSLDIYEADGNTRKAWFELPTYPDNQLRDVRFQLDVTTMTPVARLDEKEVKRAVSAHPLPDGDYVACFSIWEMRSLVKSIPLYRFKLQSGQLASFQQFELTGVWNGETVAGGG